MDLKQRKLNKSEWNSIEVPVSNSELEILNLIIAGYSDVNIKVNNTNSILTHLKLDSSDKIDDYLYNKYLRTRGDKIEEEFIRVDPNYKKIKISSDVKINSGQKIRIDRYDETSIKKQHLYEFTLLSHVENILFNRKNTNNKLFHFHYFTLYKLIRNSVSKINRVVKEITNIVLKMFEEEIKIETIIENASEFIEKNEGLLKYSDLVLYEHQKDIFTACQTKRDGSWKKGEVVNVNENGTYDILYDDGDKEIKLSGEFIRVIDNTSSLEIKEDDYVECRQSKPKLILYMAPTGTGKTLTPIALSEQKRVIFVCAARHVGIALARAAISVKKRVAFAFGCASAADIRLHYFAAKEYTVNRRTGGIGKVDNSIGTEVEIMICDIKSYLPAMYYMTAFFRASDIIMYWDEPTITLDYDDHEFHSTIRKNWKKNCIPNIVLSSATLPKQNELGETMPDFLHKFPGAEVCNIVSHDCKKSIPIINKDGFVVLPHYLDDNYEKTLIIARHCNNYLTLLRYFDLQGVVEFISYVNKNKLGNSRSQLERHFETLDDISMKSIKIYYITLLQNISPDNWTGIYTYLLQNRNPRILANNNIDSKGLKIVKSNSFGPNSYSSSNSLSGAPITRLISQQLPKTPQFVAPLTGTSGVYVTTKDAHTLTDGPTIFISNDIEKIAKFCIQQANIPSSVMDDIMKKIEYNNIINEKLHEFESEVETIKDAADKQVKNAVSGIHGKHKVAGRNKSSKDPKKLSKDVPPEFENKGTLSKLTEQINAYRMMIKSANLNDTFVPNRRMHLDKWAQGMDVNGAFTSNIDETVVSDIMALNGVENTWKVLLMMGIGVFINHENITYTEIMKRLADEQKLYMIIATSDYIYGTNYQFCHGFLSKDLNLTQEKIIQAMGRIGRNNIQQTYTVRFRDDEQIMKLFTSETDKPEIINMNRLFNTRKVIWQNETYVEIQDDLEDDTGTEPSEEETI